MKFDKIITNPPYSNLATKIITKSFEHSDVVVSLNPTTPINNIKFKSNKKPPYVYNNVSSFKEIEAKGYFDIEISTSLGIFKFTKNEKHIPLDELLFRNFSELDLKIFNKICRYPVVLGDKIKKGYNDPNKYQFMISSIRGNRNLWDWTTFYAISSYKYEIKGKYNAPQYYYDCKDENEREKLRKFLDSDILMMALYYVKFNFHNDSGELYYIPFDESLDENVLIKKLGLTDEELTYIHKKMEPFGIKNSNYENV